MNLANMFVIVFITYYTFYFIKLFSKKNRQAIKTGNKALDNLRDIPIKTLEQQKEFLDLRYPKKGKFQWTWKIIPNILWDIIKFVVVMWLYIYLFNWMYIELRLWMAIVFIMVAPIIINICLEKFGLQKSADMRVFWR